MHQCKATKTFWFKLSDTDVAVPENRSSYPATMWRTTFFTPLQWYLFLVKMQSNCIEALPFHAWKCFPNATTVYKSISSPVDSIKEEQEKIVDHFCHNNVKQHMSVSTRQQSNSKNNSFTRNAKSIWLGLAVTGHYCPKHQRFVMSYFNAAEKQLVEAFASAPRMAFHAHPRVSIRDIATRGRKSSKLTRHSTMYN